MGKTIEWQLKLIWQLFRGGQMHVGDICMIRLQSDPTRWRLLRPTGPPLEDGRATPKDVWDVHTLT